MLPSHFSSQSFLNIFFSLCICLITACSAEKPKKKLVIKPLITEEVVIKPKPTLKKDERYLPVWLSIDTKKKRLEVKRGDHVLATFNKISIGRRGAGFKKRQGDKVTPIGTYKIGWINYKSKFKIFYGFTYPSIENAKTALKRNMITSSTYRTIEVAHKNNKIPPQNTRLGGRIGLHGLGEGNEDVHKFWDWTKGCIAVTNQQIDELASWIIKGMMVKVK
ncbi:MAG: L,D-transpeptidase [Methylococcales bacterium]|nr:L,D-transpeptidase [Methylococcales bacterium]